MFIQCKAWPLIVVLLYKYVDSGLLVQWNPSLYPPWGPAKVRGGGSLVAVWILKHFLSVFINACRLLSALLSLSQFGRGRLFLVAISFYSLSLLFGPCRLSEFTLAGPPPWPLFWPSKMAIHFLIKKPLIANTVTYQYGQQPHFKIRSSRIFSNYTPLIRPLVQNFKN